MKTLFHAGPFALDVSWSEGRSFRDLKPSALARSHLRFFTAPSDEVLETISISIGDGIASLQGAPANAITRENNWRTWKTEDGSTILQVWHNSVGAFLLEANISADYRTVHIETLPKHDFRDVLEFHLVTVVTWIVSHLCIQKGGFLLHSAAIQRPAGEVIIGSGPSGAGKSTFSRFFLRRKNYRLLTDETTILLRKADKFFAYGTPWPGMLSRGSNSGGPLAALFFLEKTPAHITREIPASEAAVRLLREIFLPPWNSELTLHSLENVEAFLESVPVCALGFQKSGSVVDFLEERL